MQAQGRLLVGKNLSLYTNPGGHARRGSPGWWRLVSQPLESKRRRGLQIFWISGGNHRSPKRCSGFPLFRSKDSVSAAAHFGCGDRTPSYPRVYLRDTSRLVAGLAYEIE